MNAHSWNGAVYWPVDCTHADSVPDPWSIKRLRNHAQPHAAAEAWIAKLGIEMWNKEKGPRNFDEFMQGNQPAASPGKWIIYWPITYYENSNDYYSVMFHEIGHYVSKNDLNRDTEETVADLVALSLLHRFGIEPLAGLCGRAVAKIKYDKELFEAEALRRLNVLEKLAND